ncbi:MAG TPA: HPr family phosphocarrier protein [Clostridia bacterium]|jgi:phosphotransferase system HPr-like phosphotransfer protein|nr:HPr family phosphocarrier protein [Clostridia bacterium]HPQ46050.1 HPr family phosphocarrier protein [Clostridia bacterium]
MKHEFDIKFNSISEVKDFVDIVAGFNYDIDLVSGRYVIDAKSIMGIFSLDLNKPIKLVAYTDNVDSLKEAVSRYL